MVRVCSVQSWGGRIYVCLRFAVRGVSRSSGDCGDTMARALFSWPVGFVDSMKPSVRARSGRLRRIAMLHTRAPHSRCLDAAVVKKKENDEKN